MTITFNAMRYFSAVWFVGHDAALPLEDRMDWLAALWREVTPGSPWVLQYRFRYHRSPSPTAEEDEKSWYRATCDSTPTDAEANAREGVGILAQLTAQRNHTTVDYTPLGCDGDTAIRRLLALRKPWMHLHTAPETPQERDPHGQGGEA